MKKIISLLLLLPSILVAQNMYNVFPVVENTISGTARYIGMGGSMGALGGDISVIGSNPAGIALFRSNDINFTASVNSMGVETDYEGEKASGDNSYGAIDNVGFVLAKELDMGALKFLNVGVSYRRNNDFTRNFNMTGMAGGFSQQYIIDGLYKNSPFDIAKLDYGMYESFGHNWLSLLMAEGYYYDYTPGDDFITDRDGNLLWQPTDMAYYSDECGGADEIDFNISANINDWLYVGITLGVTNVDYGRYSCYLENDDLGKIYSVSNDYRLDGHGLNLKAGAIIRPFRYSPFKVGISIHTPTWYSLTECYSASMTGIDGYVYDTRDEERYFDDVCLKYRLNTPWRFGISASYTFGNYLAIDAEYEYADYSSVEYTRNTYGSKAQNHEIERNLKAQHTFRMGAEYKIGDFSIRTGYNHMTAPFEKSAFKNLGNANVTDTSTEYINKFEKNVFALGGGYRYRNFYFDVAYMLQMQKADFYPFYDVDYVNPAADVKLKDHSVMATVGMRF